MFLSFKRQKPIRFNWGQTPVKIDAECQTRFDPSYSGFTYECCSKPHSASELVSDNLLQIIWS